MITTHDATPIAAGENSAAMSYAEPNIADPARAIDLHKALAAASSYAAGDEGLFAAIAAWRVAEDAYVAADEDDREAHKRAEDLFLILDRQVIRWPACSLAGIVARLTIVVEDFNMWEAFEERRDDIGQRTVSIWLDLMKMAADAGLPVYPPRHIDRFPVGKTCARLTRERGILPNGASLPRGWHVDATDERWRVGETFHVAAFRWETSPVFIKAVAPEPPPGREIAGRLVGGCDTGNRARS